VTQPPHDFTEEMRPYYAQRLRAKRNLRRRVKLGGVEAIGDRGSRRWPIARSSSRRNQTGCAGASR
jgi:hypothetical protein